MYAKDFVVLSNFLHIDSKIGLIYWFGSVSLREEELGTVYKILGSKCKVFFFINIYMYCNWTSTQIQHLKRYICLTSNFKQIK